MMLDSDSMSDHVNKLRSLAEQLDSVGAQVSEENQVATLLCSLPDSYGNLIVALESSEDDLSLEFVIARSLHEEKKRSETSVSLGDSMVTALAAAKLTGSTQGQRSKASHKKANVLNLDLKVIGLKTAENPRNKKKPHEEAYITTADSHSLFMTVANSKKDESLI